MPSQEEKETEAEANIAKAINIRRFLFLQQFLVPRTLAIVPLLTTPPHRTAPHRTAAPQHRSTTSQPPPPSAVAASSSSTSAIMKHPHRKLHSAGRPGSHTPQPDTSRPDRPRSARPSTKMLASGEWGRCLSPDICTRLAPLLLRQGKNSRAAVDSALRIII